MIVFGVRIEGSVIGFLRPVRGVLADGGDARHPRRRARQFSGHGARPETFGILIMVMLGGAWVPMFLFPAWMQQVHPGGTGALGHRRPRCDDLARRRLVGAIVPTLVLLGFAAAFAAISLARFRWEEA